jgi:hypothetical protein
MMEIAQESRQLSLSGGEIIASTLGKQRYLVVSHWYQIGK